MLEHLNLFLCCFRVEMSHVGDEYEQTDKDTNDDTDEDRETDAERRDRSDPDPVGSTAAGSCSSLVSRPSTDSEGGSACRERCPACEKLFRLVGRPRPRPAMDRLSLGSQPLSGLLVEVEFGVKELAAILPRAEKRFPGRFQDAAALRVTAGGPETAVEENANNASDSCEFGADGDLRRLETIRQKIARLNTELEAKNLEILRQAACVPELRFYCRDLVRVLDFCHVQITRYGLMTDPMYSWIMNRCGDPPPPAPAPPAFSPRFPSLFFDRGYGLDALNFYRQRLTVLHARFVRRQEERVQRHETVGQRFARDSVEGRRRFIWRLEEYFSSPPGYRPPSPPPPSNQESCSEILSNDCGDSCSVMADMSIYQQ